MPNIDLSILNQRQTPAFYADTLANRPAAGFVGRIFVSTNTFAFYRDNGTGWDLIGGPGTGTITGSGTAGTIPLWSGASTIGDSILTQSGSTVELKATGGLDAVLNIDTTTGDFSRIEFQSGGNLRARAYFIESLNQLVYGTYNAGGAVRIETANNISALLIDSSQNATFYGNIIRNGGTSSQFLKADGSLDSSAYVTTNIYNGNGTLSSERTVSLNNFNLIFDGGATTARVRLDADTNVARIFSFATNNLPRFAIRVDGTESGGNTGSDYAIRRYDDAGTFVDAPLTITRSTGQSTFAKKVVIENNAGDQQLQIVSTTAPSLRFDNLQTGATKRAGLGISTATNNFIQGSADRDFCIFNGSTAAASPILFGIYDAAAVNVQEAARISPARNFLLGTTTDNGYKLQVSGVGYFSNGINVNNTTGTEMVSINNVDNSSRQGIRLNNGINSSSGIVLFNSASSTGTTTGGLLIVDQASASLSQPAVVIAQQGSADFIRCLGTSSSLNFNIASSGAVTSLNTIKAYCPTTTNQSGLIIQATAAGGGGSQPGILFINDSSINKYSNYLDVSSNTLNWGNTVATTYMQISNSGNLLINTTTDTGEKLIVNGAIRTAAPTSGTATGWKLGSYATNTVIFDTAHYVEVEINGVAYRLALAL